MKHKLFEFLLKDIKFINKYLLIIGIFVILAIAGSTSYALFSYESYAPGTIHVVFKDIQGPILNVINPTSNDETNPTLSSNVTYTINGTVSDKYSSVKSITVNGTSATINSDGTWNKSISLTANTTNIITIIATDNLNNTTTVTRYVLYKNNPVFYISNIDGSNIVEYDFEEGMTWEEFVASSYNDGLFRWSQTTYATLFSEGNFSSTRVQGAVGYNGFCIFGITYDRNNLSEELGLSMPYFNNGNSVFQNPNIVAGKTYYSDGVDSVAPSKLIIYEPGSTEFQNVIRVYKGYNITESFGSSWLTVTYNGSTSSTNFYTIQFDGSQISWDKLVFTAKGSFSNAVQYGLTTNNTSFSGSYNNLASTMTKYEINNPKDPNYQLMFQIKGGNNVMISDIHFE